MLALCKESLLYLIDQSRLSGSGQTCHPDCLRLLSLLLCTKISCDVHIMPCQVVITAKRMLNDTTCRCHIGDTIDQNETAKFLMMLELIEYDRVRAGNVTAGNLVLIELICLNMGTFIDINLILDIHNNSRHHLGSKLQEIVLSCYKLIIIHPQKSGCKHLIGMQIHILTEHTASGYIDLCIKLDRYCLTLGGIINLLICIKDALYLSCLTTWQRGNLISDVNLANLNLSLKTTESAVRTAYTLYRHNETCLVGMIGNIDRLQIILKSTTLVPRCLCRLCRNIITNCCRYRNNMHCLEIILSGHDLDLLYNILKLILIVINKIHLIDRINNMLDTHQCADTCMASCLNQNALGSVHKDNRQICEGCTNRHVTGILLMTRCICYDKASLFCRKITICNIDRDSLLTLCHQSVKQ